MGCLAEERLHQTDRDQHEHRRDERVGGERKGKPRLANATQVDKDDHARQASESATLCGSSDGAIEVTAKMPAAIETATVST